jgi:hypothetical protein
MEVKTEEETRRYRSILNTVTLTRKYIPFRGPTILSVYIGLLRDATSYETMLDRQCRMIDRIAHEPKFTLGPSFDHIGGRPTNDRVDTLQGFSKLKSKLSKDFHGFLLLNFCLIVYVGGGFPSEFLLIEPVFM